MCGIWTYFIKQHLGLSEEDLGKMFPVFMNTKGRGPDNHDFKVVEDKFALGFHRLAIIDPTNDGDQPFKFYDASTDTNYYCICNGEIYNAEKLKLDYESDKSYQNKYVFKSKSDCEVLIPLYIKYKQKIFEHLDGVFSFVIIILKDHQYDVFAGRDPFGVRPSFIGYNEKNGNVGISSEMKSLIGLFERIEPFTPGHYLTFNNHDKEEFKYNQYHSYDYKYQLEFNRKEVCKLIRAKLEDAVRKRLISDRPVCALLSGGLDSSSVCAIASKMLKEQGKKLYTFSIGMKGSPDLKFAQEVADFIGSEHTNVIVTNEICLNNKVNTIWATESFDNTTTRASNFQYLISEYISKNTDFKVVLSGDGSDELTSGYLYNYNAPTFEELHIEAIRKLKEIYLYDGLRADRATSIHGLELRVPFLDLEFVRYYLSINSEFRKPTKEHMEKSLLRESLVGYLPESVLFRQKEAFSDGTTPIEDAWHTTGKKNADAKFTDEEFNKLSQKYSHCKPRNKEELEYRIIFDNHGFGKHDNVIPEFWQFEWTDSDDPSARTIKDIHNSTLSVLESKSISK